MSAFELRYGLGAATAPFPKSANTGSDHFSRKLKSKANMSDDYSLPSGRREVKSGRGLPACRMTD